MKESSQSLVSIFTKIPTYILYRVLLDNLLHTNLNDNFGFGLQNWCDRCVEGNTHIIYEKFNGESIEDNFKPIETIFAELSVN